MWVEINSDRPATSEGGLPWALWMTLKGFVREDPTLLLLIMRWLKTTERSEGKVCGSQIVIMYILIIQSKLNLFNRNHQILSLQSHGSLQSFKCWTTVMCLADGRVEKSKYVNQNKKDTTEDSTTCWLSLGNEQGREG